jgi:PAS domain S-box-containing protein
MNWTKTDLPLPNRISSFFPTTFRLLVILTLAVFLSEMRNYLHISFFSNIPEHIGILFHILITTSMVFPFLYFFAYRPLLEQITRRERTQAELEKAWDEMEMQVQDRTAELLAANQALHTEIDERRRVQKMLTLQTAAVEAAANGIVILDCEGTIEWCNQAFTQMSGYTSDEVIGQKLNILHSGQHREELFEEMWQTILSGQVWHGETINKRKDNTIYFEEQTITPVCNENGKISHFISIKQDITSRKEAEADLEKSYIDLQQLTQAEHYQRQLAESLVQATLAFANSLNPDEVLDHILEQLHKVIPCTASAIFLMERNMIHMVRHRGVKERIPGIVRLESGIPLDQLPQSQRAVTSRHPVLASAADLEDEWSILPGLEWIRSAITAPLLAKDEVLGVLVLVSEKDDHFQNGQLELIQAFAAHAVLAIQNARIFDELLQSREHLKGLTRRLVEVQEAERRTISRELHDEAGQALTSIKLGLNLLEREVGDPLAVHERLTEMEKLTDQVMENLHNLAIDLRPASLEYLGLINALQQYLSSIKKNNDIKVEFESLGIDKRLPIEIEITLYRIVQEAVTNILRHARASLVDVLVERRDKKLVAIIEDNGVGFNPAIYRRTGHLGLFGMRERAEMFGGRLVIESKPGSGTTVFVEIPYDD